VEGGLGASGAAQRARQASPGQLRPSACTAEVVTAGLVPRADLRRVEGAGRGGCARAPCPTLRCLDLVC
jgi:hypothetical protein